MSTTDPLEPAHSEKLPRAGRPWHSGVSRGWVGLGLSAALLLVLLTGAWIHQTTAQNHKLAVLQAQQTADRTAAAKLQAAAASAAAARAKAAADAAAAADKARTDAAIAKALGDAADAKAQAKATKQSTVIVQQPTYYGYYDNYGYYHPY